jgi:hypothetical protein
VGARIEAIAERLFADIMAPLVLGGPMRPGHVLGFETARALADLANATPPPPVDQELASRVAAARVRRARLLVPIDEMGPAAGAEWALAAALHDVLQAANPGMAAPLRRRAALRIVTAAAATIERVGGPATVREALARHAWFARALEVTRTDTQVSWWTGSRTFRGVDPPARLRAWPSVRRVTVMRRLRTLLDLAPLAIDAELFASVVGQWLAATPLTDLATCTRAAPVFAWSPATLGLVATPVGRTLALRALARWPQGDVDASLGRATEKLGPHDSASLAARALLADRAAAATAESPPGTPLKIPPARRCSAR